MLVGVGRSTYYNEHAAVGDRERALVCALWRKHRKEGSFTTRTESWKSGCGHGGIGYQSSEWCFTLCYSVDYHTEHKKGPRDFTCNTRRYCLASCKHNIKKGVGARSTQLKTRKGAGSLVPQSIRANATAQYLNGKCRVCRFSAAKDSATSAFRRSRSVTSYY